MTPSSPYFDFDIFTHHLFIKLIYSLGVLLVLPSLWLHNPHPFFPFAILPPSLHSYDLIPISSSANGRPLQHGKALISCITTFWINPVWTLWAAVAASQGLRPPRTSQRTLTMTVYGRPTVTGWALFPVRAPTSPTKIKLPLTPLISNDFIFI